MPNQTIIHRKTAITRRNRKLSIVKPVFFLKKNHAHQAISTGDTRKNTSD